eukprot:2949678-Rhodomonas_salina.1
MRTHFAECRGVCYYYYCIANTANGTEVQQCQHRARKGIMIILISKLMPAYPGYQCTVTTAQATSRARVPWTWV